MIKLKILIFFMIIDNDNNYEFNKFYIDFNLQ